jgi:hypothetical protein
MRQQQGES